MKWFNRGVEDRIALFLFLLYTVENFLFFFISTPPIQLWIVLSSFFFFFFWCKKPRSLASPLPGVQWSRGKVSFSKKPMTGYVTMLVLSETLSKPVVRVVKSFTFRFNDVWMETEVRLKNIIDRFFYKVNRYKNIFYSFVSFIQLGLSNRFNIRRIRNVNRILCNLSSCYFFWEYLGLIPFYRVTNRNCTCLLTRLKLADTVFAIDRTAFPFYIPFTWFVVTLIPLLPEETRGSINNLPSLSFR